MNVSNVGTTQSATDKGTKIVKKGEGLDKDAFLKILSAELSNQDPTNAKDGTEFVAQMAQFAGLEQMTNLNNTMKFSSMSSLIGKYVTLNSLDSNGNLYSGAVKSVSKVGDSININVLVGKEKDENGNMVDWIKEFSSDNLLDIVETPSNE